jgi:WD40 repeat protein
MNFSPDGQTIASGGSDGMVTFWNIDGSKLGSIQVHQSAVRSVKFSPDGQSIISGGADGTVKLTSLNVDQLLNLACDWASDYLRTNSNVTAADRAICGIPTKGKAP